MTENPDIGPAELILVRHGESVRNHASDLAHHGDFSLLERQMREEPDEALWPLTAAGHRQAAQAGAWIRQHLGDRFDAAYVSPFIRTLETVADLGLNVHWTIDDRLREREWGDYSDAYSASQYLHDLGRCSELEWRSGFRGGESVLDLMPRVSEFFADALTETPRGRILAVTHGGTIRAFQSLLEHLCAGSQCPDHRLSNCCIVQYRLDRITLSRREWTGSVQTYHPTLPGAPESGWQPLTPTAVVACD